MLRLMAALSMRIWKLCLDVVGCSLLEVVMGRWCDNDRAQDLAI